MNRPLPPDLPGICPTCGYQTHGDNPCAWYPCHRCIHRIDTPPLGPGASLDLPPPPWPRRDDGSHGYTPAEYLNCPCACHRPFINALNLHHSASHIPTPQSERRRTRAVTHKARILPAETEQDWT